MESSNDSSSTSRGAIHARHAKEATKDYIQYMSKCFLISTTCGFYVYWILLID